MAEDPKRPRGTIQGRERDLNPIESLASRLIDASLADLRLPLACPCEFGHDSRYLLEEVIGVGSDSFVYRATDLKLSSEGFPSRVAIKIHASGESTLSEAVLARRVYHENVVQVLDSGRCEDGTSFLVTELMAGGDLNSLSLPMDPKEAARLMSQVARGIQALHSAGVSHGDLKPANILLTERGVPKVADFDLASCDDDARKGGNYAFICPEHVADESNPPAPPADIYALGGILYHLATNRLPNGQTWEQIRKRLSTPGAVPAPLGIDIDLDQICRRALAHERTRRFTSAGMFADDLDAWLGHHALPWTNPGSIRLIRLWSLRRPVHAVVSFLLVLGVIGTAIGVLQASHIANTRVEKTRQMVRNALASASASSGLGADSSPRDVIIANMVWLEYLSKIPVLQSDGSQLGAELRVERLEAFTARMDELGRSAHMDTRLAQYVLAYTLLQLDRLREAVPLLDGPLAHWRQELDATDAVALTIDAMQLSRRAMTETTKDADDWIAELLAEREILTEVGDCKEAILVLDAAIKNIRGL